MQGSWKYQHDHFIGRKRLLAKETQLKHMGIFIKHALHTFHVEPNEKYFQCLFFSLRKSWKNFFLFQYIPLTLHHQSHEIMQFLSTLKFISITEIRMTYLYMYMHIPYLFWFQIQGCGSHCFSSQREKPEMREINCPFWEVTCRFLLWNI